MWSGIGGRTIEQAKRNMTYREYLKWVEFRRLRGSLFTGRRIEQAVGRLSYMYEVSNTGKKHKADINAHMPHEDRAQGRARAKKVRPAKTAEQQINDFKRFIGA